MKYLFFTCLILGFFIFNLTLYGNNEYRLSKNYSNIIKFRNAGGTDMISYDTGKTWRVYSKSTHKPYHEVTLFIANGIKWSRNLGRDWIDSFYTNISFGDKNVVLNPLPAKDLVSISIANHHDGITKMFIYDVKGYLLSTKEIKFNIGSSIIDLSVLPTGSYIVFFEIDNEFFNAHLTILK